MLLNLVTEIILLPHTSLHIVNMCFCASSLTPAELIPVHVVRAKNCNKLCPPNVCSSSNKNKRMACKFSNPIQLSGETIFVANIFTEMHKHNMWAFDVHIFTNHFTLENFQTKQPGGFCWRKTLFRNKPLCLVENELLLVWLSVFYCQHF